MIDKEITKLSRSLFWDVPQDIPNIQRIVNENPDWTIERVFEYGTMQDIRQVLAWYGKEKAISVLCSSHFTISKKESQAYPGVNNLALIQ